MTEIETDDYRAAALYVAAQNQAIPARRYTRGNSWSRRDWPVAIPVLACWIYWIGIAIYNWVMMLTVHDVPPGYLVTPIFMVLLFGGPAVLPWLYHPSAFKTTAVFYSCILLMKMPDSDSYTARELANLVVFAGVVAAGWISQTRRLRYDFAK